MKKLAILLPLCLSVGVSSYAATIDHLRLAQRYEQLLLFEPGDYRVSRVARRVFKEDLLLQFEKAVEDAQSYPFERRGEHVYYLEALETLRMASQTQEEQEAKIRFFRLFSSTLPMLAYAYRTPGPNSSDNPHYHSEDLLGLYVYLLEYCYSRGLTEQAWTPDHSGNGSARAEVRGMKRMGGDFSGVSLHLGGLVQSIFLMRKPLAKLGILDRYRRVVRNLAINNGTMFGAFFHHAREEAGTNYPNPLPEERHYHLNADGVRLFADYFIPYFLLIEDAVEREEMKEVLRRVISANAVVRPGNQGTIKPDGTGFHHGAAYMSGYSPFTFESFARLLYLFEGTDLFAREHLEAVKLALESFRVMVQKYTVSSALRGRLIEGNEDAAATAVTRAMALLAHPDGPNDAQMRARFNEYFDPDYFFSRDREGHYHHGQRGVSIRGLGIYRLVGEVLDMREAGEVPSGAFIKPYAAAAFFRRDHWLVVAKGFSRYLWDYEGPLKKRQNSFGQNWSNGLLQVFSAGVPVSEVGSGYDLENGWDWYQVPGTTASHYAVKERSYREVVTARDQAGIEWPDPQRNYNSKAFVGGVTLGDHGFFVQDLEAVPFTAPTDLTARKSYFFVGDKVLAMGTHISGGTEGDATRTTLFQTRVLGSRLAGSINGKRAAAGERLRERVAAGSQALMTDSVGNSFLLVRSTADLHFASGSQDSLTPRYQPTSGRFVKAYLDHGIKPENDRYLYVVIPSDPGARKLEALAEDASRYFRVIESDAMHLVEFPEWRITAYAFFEPSETTQEQTVKRVSMPAAIITQENDASLRLAASVPDLGWDSDDRQLFKGLAYGSRHYATQTAKMHRLQVILRGHWKLSEPASDISTEFRKHETHLQVPCKDGLSRQLTLRPVN